MNKREKILSRLNEHESSTPSRWRGEFRMAHGPISHSSVFLNAPLP